MGVKDLLKLIKLKAPSSLVKRRLSHLTGWKVAVDVSIFLYRFIKGKSGDYWLETFARFAAIFSKYSIVPVFIFDGKAPDEKDEEKEDRHLAFKRLEERIQEIQDLIDKEKLEDGDVEKIRKILGIEETVPFGVGNKKTVNLFLEEKINRLSKQAAPITKDASDKVFELLTALGFATLKAPGEAEAFCSHLCKKGYVDGVVTNDSDSLAYGVPFMLREMNIITETCEIVTLADVLKEMKISFESFVDLCILLGCDYNTRTKLESGTSVGMIKGYTLIQSYEIIEKIPGLLKEPLKVDECRGIFASEFPIPKNLYKKFPDWGKVEELIGHSTLVIKDEPIVEYLKSYIRSGPVLEFE